MKATISNSVTLLGRNAVHAVDFDSTSETLNVYFHEELLYLTSDKKVLMVGNSEYPCSKFGLTVSDVEALIAHHVDEE